MSDTEDQSQPIEPIQALEPSVPLQPIVDMSEVHEMSAQSDSIHSIELHDSGVHVIVESPVMPEGE